MNNTKDGIILFAKQTGLTSFASLSVVKKSLATKKIGHTGTLDSFASGLLVLCSGNLTRLSSYITGFRKTYDAVIEFGKETDTLEWTGNVIKEKCLPKKEDVEKAVNSFVGNIMQEPPVFSALHINGKRASDLVRKGESVHLPKRPVTIFDASIKDFLLSSNGSVKALLVSFTVSKGTYIRSLSRDIAYASGSVAHLVGLRRTSVGNFKIEDAFGKNLLCDFSIKNVYEEIKNERTVLQSVGVSTSCTNQNENVNHNLNDDLLKTELKKNILEMTPKLASLCDLKVFFIKDEYEIDFFHGRTISEKMFFNTNHKNDYEKKIISEGSVILQDTYLPIDNRPIAVFSTKEKFLGMIKKTEEGLLKYVFVVQNLT